MPIGFYHFQKRDDAREFMKFLHPDLGVGKDLVFLFMN